jgi:uncharacterized peroxidase-related enzyme
MTQETLLNSIKSTDTIMNIFMENQNRFLPILDFAENILREESFLSPADREFIAAFTSSLNQCKFCTGSHKVFAESVGANSKELNDAIDGNYQDNRLKPILDYVKKLTMSPSSLTKSDVDNVINAGFSENELKDAIVVCAAFNFFNRIVEGHGIQENSQTWNESSEMILEFGYNRKKKTKEKGETE